MIRQRAGKIITVTSTAGRTGSRGMAAYAAAKAGAAVLMQSMGAEWAKYGILVNAVAPGPVETEGVLEVWKTPAMIAQAARACRSSVWAARKRSRGRSSSSRRIRRVS